MHFACFRIPHEFVTRVLRFPPSSRLQSDTPLGTLCLALLGFRRVKTTAFHVFTCYKVYDVLCSTTPLCLRILGTWHAWDIYVPGYRLCKVMA